MSEEPHFTEEQLLKALDKIREIASETATHYEVSPEVSEQLSWIESIARPRADHRAPKHDLSVLSSLPMDLPESASGGEELYE